MSLLIKRLRKDTRARPLFSALILFLSVTSFFLPTVSAQRVADQTAPVPKARPRVGLVLSGGGARGFAHIGVLRVLEANHIPVDYVAGASMGALVGALYATGRTPAEMEDLVETLDWSKLLRGRPDFDDLTFRRKQDRRNLPGAITLGGQKTNLRLPSSLNPGHEIGLVLDSLMLPYSDNTEFDSLPIPFRAVATDLVKAETVVLKDGSLAQALRATMSIPAVFAPVELNGRILADGGILNNIPTDVVKDMGADIILVVNIETQLGDRSSLLDLVGILGQTFYVATVENSRRSLRQADIIVAPDLKNYGSFDYDAGKEIVELGALGAEAKVALLRSLAVSDEDWQKYITARQAKVLPTAKPVPEFIAIEGTKNPNAVKRIKSKLDDNYENKPLDEKALGNDLTQLTGTERFDNLGYGITRRDNKTGLAIRVYDPAERTDRTSVLEVGVDVNNTENDDVNFNARARLTFFDIGREGSEWRNDLSLGSRVFLGTEFYRPFAGSRFFAAPNAFYEKRRVDFFEDGNRLAEYSFRTTQAGIDVGYTASRNSELRFGYSLGHQKASRRIGNSQFADLSGRLSFASLRWNFDTRNNSQIPTSGIEFRNSINYYFAAPGTAVGFPQAESDISVFRTLNDKYTVFGLGAAGTSFGRTAPLFQQFTLGGLFNVGGYGSGEFRNSNYLRGSFGVLRHTFSAPTFIGGKAYFGAWYEAGSAFEELDLAKYRHSVTGGLLLETRIGPVFFGGSFAEGGRTKLYFNLGRVF